LAVKLDVIKASVTAYLQKGWIEEAFVALWHVSQNPSLFQACLTAVATSAPCHDLKQTCCDRDPRKTLRRSVYWQQSDIWKSCHTVLDTVIEG
jgi:hypothetical protein